MMKQKSIWRIILRSVQAAGLVFVVIACVMFFQKLSFVMSAEVAIGEVIKFNQRGEGNDLRFYPTVQFLDSDDNPVSFESAMGEKVPAYEPGEFVSVYYEQQNPSAASIKGFGELWGLSIFLASLGIALFVLTTTIFRVYRSSELLQDLADRKSHNRNPGDALY